MIDQKALIAWLEDRAKNAPVGDASMLVQYSLYQGIADRVRRGDFDMEEQG